MSAVAALGSLGVTRVRVAARSAERARSVLQLCAALGVEGRYAPLGETIDVTDSDVVVSTLPGPAASEHRLVHDGAALPVLFDISYDPWPVHLAESWRGRGGTAFTGLDMLVEQAIEQVRIFVTGVEGGDIGPVDEVRRAMMDAAFATLQTRQ